MQKNDLEIRPDYFTLKKERTMFLLSILVFTIHISTLKNYDLSSDLGQVVMGIKTFITAFARMAVPLFMIISGALFFKSYSYDKTGYKIKSRIHTLFIPYLAWNTIWMCFEFFRSNTSISRFFVGREIAQITIPNILEGIFLRKYNMPFWFIFDLMLFTLISPLTYTFLKNKKVGFFSLCAIAVIIEMGVLPKFSYLFYCIGAYIGIHYFDQFHSQNKRSVRILSAIIVVAFTILKALNNVIADSYVILSISAVALWIVADIVVGKKNYKFEKTSFLIFAMHINVGAVITKLLYLIFPKNEIFAPINFVLTILFTVGFIYIFQIIINEKFPKIRKILCGR